MPDTNDGQDTRADENPRTENDVRPDEITRAANEERHLSPREEHDVEEHLNLSARAVYTVVKAEGEEELRRPMSSLWWSAVAAGIGISGSVLAEGLLHFYFQGSPYRPAIENLGYTVGFILVILGRLQLFTENTITVVLPVISNFSTYVLRCALRLWAVVFAGNLVGTFVTAVLVIVLGTSSQEHIDAMLAISHHFADKSFYQAFAHGIPAGFFIAAIVWMLPSSEGFEIFTIFVFTYLIALGGFSHVIAGSAEVFMLLVSGELNLFHGVFGLILPSLVGNIVGGTLLFALLAYAQVKAEIE